MCDRVYIQTNTLAICSFLAYLCVYGWDSDKIYSFKHAKFFKYMSYFLSFENIKGILPTISQKNLTNHFLLIYSHIWSEPDPFWPQGSGFGQFRFQESKSGFLKDPNPVHFDLKNPDAIHLKSRIRIRPVWPQGSASDSFDLKDPNPVRFRSEESGSLQSEF